MSATAEAVEPVELERLRRRLYVPGATGGDVAAYEAALASRPAPAAPPTERRRLTLPGGRVPRGAALALAVAALSAAAALLAPRIDGGTAEVRPPLVGSSSSFGLTATNGVQRSIDTLFFTGSSAKAADAFGELDDLARHVALPGATDSTVLTSSSGDGQGAATVGTAREPLPVERGSILLLSVIANRPTDAAWTFTGWREGEPHRPHPILLMRPAARADRLLIGAMRVPAAMTITSIRIRTAPTSAVFYRFEVHAASVCAGYTAARCPARGG